MDKVILITGASSGRTGPAAAAWLQERGVASIFVTGQAEVAAEHPGVVLGTLSKPVFEKALVEKLELVREHVRS